MISRTGEAGALPIQLLVRFHNFVIYTKRIQHAHVRVQMRVCGGVGVRTGKRMRRHVYNRRAARPTD